MLADAERAIAGRDPSLASGSFTPITMRTTTMMSDGQTLHVDFDVILALDDLRFPTRRMTMSAPVPVTPLPTMIFAAPLDEGTSRRMTMTRNRQA
jgi:hypothetical protein